MRSVTTADGISSHFGFSLMVRATFVRSAVPQVGMAKTIKRVDASRSTENSVAPLYMKRKILVILSNRWNRLQAPHYLEVMSDDEGTILSQKKLRTQPRKAVYDEVWENDEGKMDFAASHRFKRKYSHKLQKIK